MRPFKIMIVFVVIAILMTGIAGTYSAHAGPPDKHKHFVSYNDLISHDVFDITDPMEVPLVYTTPLARLDAGLPVYLVYDIGYRTFADFKLTYDFNHWKYQIKPLLPQKFKSVQLRT